MSKVLVVDDHTDSCDTLVRLLRYLGHDAAWAHSGPEALAFVHENPTRLVLLDVSMPGMDGIEVLRRLREEHRLDGLTVVMFSAVADPSMMEQAKELGARDYLVKAQTPFDTLRETVERYAGNPH